VDKPAAEARDIIFVEEKSRDLFKIIDTGMEGLPLAAVHHSKTETKIYPFVEIDMHKDALKSPFVLRIYDKVKSKAKEEVHDHPFVLASIISGVAIGILTIKRIRNKK
jgi:hypothetical protein